MFLMWFMEYKCWVRKLYNKSPLRMHQILFIFCGQCSHLSRRLIDILSSPSLRYKSCLFVFFISFPRFLVREFTWFWEVVITTREHIIHLHLTFSWWSAIQYTIITGDRRTFCQSLFWKIHGILKASTRSLRKKDLADALKVLLQE